MPAQILTRESLRRIWALQYVSLHGSEKAACAGYRRRYAGEDLCSSRPRNFVVGGLSSLATTSDADMQFPQLQHCCPAPYLPSPMAESFLGGVAIS
jgi:hypothetical protein